MNPVSKGKVLPNAAPSCHLKKPANKKAVRQTCHSAKNASKKTSSSGKARNVLTETPGRLPTSSKVPALTFLSTVNEIRNPEVRNGLATKWQGLVHPSVRTFSHKPPTSTLQTPSRGVSGGSLSTASGSTLCTLPRGVTKKASVKTGKNQGVLSTPQTKATFSPNRGISRHVVPSTIYRATHNTSESTLRQQGKTPCVLCGVRRRKCVSCDSPTCLAKGHRRHPAMLARPFTAKQPTKGASIYK